jgi:hypothetical protein
MAGPEYDLGTNARMPVESEAKPFLPKSGQKLTRHRRQPQAFTH